MDRDFIFDLIDRLETSSLSEIEVETEDGYVRLAKPAAEGGRVSPTRSGGERAGAPATASGSSAVAEHSGSVMKSPIVGTFYRKPAPDAAPFVEVGSRVKAGDILCIVEAMKLMNEIESELDGTVQEVLVADGDLVEFGQPLFVIA